MKKRLFIFTAILLAAVMLLSACSFPKIVKTGRGGSGSARFERGDVSIEADGTVDSQGGVIKLPDTSPLAGTYVTFMAASVDQPVNVSIGTVTGRYKDSPESIAETALYVDLGEFEDLSQPVEITFDYAETEEDAGKVPAGLCIDEEGYMTPVITRYINEEDGTFTILTYHGGTYTYYFLDDIADYPESAATGFLPSTDGFSEVNQGSSIFSGGECYGMSTFAKWYFLNHKTGGDDAFFSLFQSPEMGVSPTGDVIVPQDIIATKAFQYTTKESRILFTTESRFSSYITIDEDGTETYINDNSVAVRCIMDSLYFWQEPVEVGIYGTAGHSVLAYSYLITDTTIFIYIYDPNYPGDDNQYIAYDIASNTISTPAYSAGILDERLTTTGYGTFSSVSDYETILEDAKNNFANSLADLEITSPVNGAEIAEGTCYIEGTVDTLEQMGEQLGDAIEVISEDGQIFRADLYKNGTSPSDFSIQVPVKRGENRFLVNILYYDEFGNEHYLSSDMFGWLLINSTVAGNVIYVTLTWDAQPDVDLYVTDPTGSTSYWSNPVTADGGVLDIDDTSGYGPEHWTLTTNNVVRWGEPYTIRLHYYDGDGPTSYSVTVTTNEGTIYETTQTYTGVISSSNMDNYEPGSFGADWVDICTVTPIDTDNAA
jgi:hypothetical protein